MYVLFGVMEKLDNINERTDNRQFRIRTIGEEPYNGTSLWPRKLPVYRKGDPNKTSSLPELTRPGVHTRKPVKLEFTEQNT